jgi:hypothetical protein
MEGFVGINNESSHDTQNDGKYNSADERIAPNPFTEAGQGIKSAFNHSWRFMFGENEEPTSTPKVMLSKTDLIELHKKTDKESKCEYNAQVYTPEARKMIGNKLYPISVIKNEQGFGAETTSREFSEAFKDICIYENEGTYNGVVDLVNKNINLLFDKNLKKKDIIEMSKRRDAENTSEAVYSFIMEDITHPHDTFPSDSDIYIHNTDINIDPMDHGYTGHKALTIADKNTASDDVVNDALEKIGRDIKEFKRDLINEASESLELEGNKKDVFNKGLGEYLDNKVGDLLTTPASSESFYPDPEAANRIDKDLRGLKEDVGNAMDGTLNMSQEEREVFLKRRNDMNKQVKFVLKNLNKVTEERLSQTNLNPELKGAILAVSDVVSDKVMQVDMINKMGLFPALGSIGIEIGKDMVDKGLYLGALDTLADDVEYQSLAYAKLTLNDKTFSEMEGHLESLRETIEKPLKEMKDGFNDSSWDHIRQQSVRYVLREYLTSKATGSVTGSFNRNTTSATALGRFAKTVTTEAGNFSTSKRIVKGTIRKYGALKINSQAYDGATKALGALKVAGLIPSAEDYEK